MKTITAAVAVPLAALLLAAPAHAQKCGNVRDTGGLQALNIVASKTTCKTAKSVATDYARRGTNPARDSLRRAWRCRVTQRATGTDPGFIPRTKVRCTRASSSGATAIVRFELAS